MNDDFPSYVPPVVEINRPGADTINRLENTRQTEMYSGFSEVIPVVYGEQIISGPRLVDPYPWGENGYVWAIALGHGPMESIIQIRANGGAWVDANGPNGWNTDSALSVNLGNGLTVRARYDGSQNTPDPRLSMRIPGFADVFPGVAYAVLEFTVQPNSTTLPEAEFRVRGRKILDPRTSLVAWTENPSLHLADFASNAVWGLGRDVQGVVAAANANDSLYSGLPRSLSGLTIQDPLTELDAMDQLAAYAEVMWGYDGETITLIPDMPVEGPIDSIPADQIIEGTLDLTSVGIEQMPTQVSIIFTDRSAGSDWTTRPAQASIPFDALLGQADTRSDVRMPGVFRRVEAERRAWQRLNRLQTPGRIAWQMMSLGVQYQPGDVVLMPEIQGLSEALVRITSQPEMAAPGRYQLQGEFYSATQYPDDGGGVGVPVGAIVPYFGALPSGYATWARGGFLVGDEVGGEALTATPGAAALTLSVTGGHSGEFENLNRAGTSAGTPTGIMIPSSSSATQRGNHTHGVSASYANLLNSLPMHRMTWAKKTNTPGPLVAGIGFLSPSVINVQRISAVMAAVGRYLAAGATRASQAAQTSVAGTTAPGGAHFHGDNSYNLGAGSDVLTFFQEAGDHTHIWTATVAARLKSKRLALYQAIDEVLIQPGAIIGWEDGVPPAGWAVCNGDNGTIDLRGYFIELSRPDQAGTVASEDNVMQITNVATNFNGAHNHRRTVSNANAVPFGSSGRHNLRLETHAHSGTNRTLTDILPGRYTFRFIQYIGE